MEISFGAHRSKPDYRDIQHEDITLAGIVPSIYTENYSTIPVTMQNKIGICTSNLCYLMQKNLQKQGINVVLSRRFLYTVTKRYIDNNTQEGSSLRSALKAAYNYGVALESTVPTDTTVSHADFIKEYEWPQSVWDEALKYRIDGYVSVKIDRDAIAKAIYECGGIYARVEVGKEWYTNTNGYGSWLSKDILPLRRPITPISGHAIVPFAYDNSNTKFDITLRNSWSTGWANQGNGDLLLEDYSPDFTEAWTITLQPIVNTLPKKNDFNHIFLRDLAYGDMNSEEVKQLQIFLKIFGFFNYPIVTGNYGKVTQDAVYQFQLEYVTLSFWEKYFLRGSKIGEKTRTAINSMVKGLHI